MGEMTPTEGSSTGSAVHDPIEGAPEGSSADGEAPAEMASSRSLGARLGELAGWLAFLLMAALFAVVLRDDAGLRGWSVVVALAAPLPLYLIARGWRLPWWLHAAAASLPVSIVLIGLLAQGGWTGAARGAGYAAGALAFLALVAWARTARKRLALAGAVAFLALYNFTVGWFFWWAQQDPTNLMYGTFYWHNQFAAYCVGGAAVGFALLTLGKRVWVLMGALTIALMVPGVLASGSRAGLTLLVLVAVAMLVVALLARGWRGAIRWLVGPVLGVLASFYFTSTVFFDTAVNPFVRVIARSANGSLETSTTARFEFWWHGLLIGAEHPVAGGGLNSFAVRSQCYAASAGSSNPHNEWVLAWSDGGVIGVLPFLAIAAGLVMLVLRNLRPVPSREALLSDPGRWGGLVAIVPLLVHVAFDFDWSYPSLVGIAALTAALAAAPVARLPEPRTPGNGRRALVGLVLVLLLLGSALIARVADPFPDNPLRANPMADVPVSEICPSD